MHIFHMKNALLIVVCLLFSFTSFTQSYFNDVGQGSRSVGILFSPEQSLDITKFLYSISVKGRVDITPFIGYGSRGIGGSLFNGGLAVDYFALKQSETMPLSFSVGGLFDYNYTTRVGITNTTQIGTLRSNVYHKLTLENFSLIPILGYQYQFFINDINSNDTAIEIAAAVGLELNGGQLMYFKPSILFPMGTTQYFLNLGYMF